jgi:hypothetical protein
LSQSTTALPPPWCSPAAAAFSVIASESRNTSRTASSSDS